MRFLSSLRTHLVLLVLLATLPALALTAYIGTAASAKEHMRAQDEVYRLAQQVSAKQDDVIIGSQELLTVLAQDPDLRPFSGAGCSAILASLLQIRQQYTNVFIVDTQGYSICSGLPLAQQTFSGDRLWFQRTVQGRKFGVGEYVIGRGSGKPVITVGYPILDSQGNLEAVLSAGIDLAWLNSLLAATKLPAGGTLTVYDHNDVVLARQPNPQDWVGKPSPAGSIGVTVLQRRDGTAAGRGLDGVERLYGFVPLGSAETGVYISVGVPEGMAYAVANDLLLHSLLALVGVALLAVVSAWVGGHFLIVRQVRGLVASTSRLSHGDLDARAAARASSSELHQLASAFNTMAGVLQQRECEAQRAAAQLVASQGHLAAIVESLLDGVVIYDTEGRITLVNAAAGSLLGKTPAELIGMRLDDQRWQWRTLEDAPLPLAEALQRVQLSGQKLLNRELILLRDGQEFILAGSAFPLLEGEVATSVVTVFADITQRKLQEVALQEANSDLTASVMELQQRNEETAVLGELSDVLQACQSEAEALAAIGRTAAQLFLVTAGAIYLINPSRTLADPRAVWGDAGGSQQLFQPHECWALRRGRSHTVTATSSGIPCAHVRPEISSALCLPMLAEGEALGVFHLEQEDGPFSEAIRRLAQIFTDQVALALANVQLRETLQNQAMRDPLTGLFNRRHMEEALERELHRALRRQTPVSVLMLDLDHFKHFNDTFGHGAGDVVLRVIADYLAQHVRGEDIACRYGGEELTVILPEAQIADATRRADLLRQGIADLQVMHHGQLLGTVTVSIGVATLDSACSTADELLTAADAALYRAKAAGRNQVQTAPTRLDSNAPTEAA